MAKKRLTQRFPWLVPLRRRQRVFCFYWGMRLDGRRYAAVRSGEELPRRAFEANSPLYNRETGWDMRYQENKVHNLKLAAAMLDGMLIQPGETFSFCRAIRRADHRVPYKDGLTVVDGKLTAAPGGGLCQLSNLLFWLFLHVPLTVVERHGHGTRDFPDPDGGMPLGVDATISEGWLDLKVKNETADTFQLRLSFDPEHLTGRLLSSAEPEAVYRVVNGAVTYWRRDGAVYEEAEVVREKFPAGGDEAAESQLLYRNVCRIGYPLPEGIPVIEKEKGARL